MTTHICCTVNVHGVEEKRNHGVKNSWFWHRRALAAPPLVCEPVGKLIRETAVRDCICRKLCRLTAVQQHPGTAGRNAGRGPGDNPVACDNSLVQYNLNNGIFNFSVQATDLAVSLCVPTTRNSGAFLWDTLRQLRQLM